MSKFLFANMANSTIAYDISSESTAIILTTGDGARFSFPDVDEEFRAILFNPQGLYEIVGVEKRIADSLQNVSRGLEGTRKLSWAAGTLISQRVTKEIYDTFLNATKHEAITDRSDPDAHPVSAITELQTVLNAIEADILATNVVIDAHKADVSDPHSVEADQVAYDNSVSGLTATDTNGAIDEIAVASSGVHNNTTDRDAVDAHPQLAVTGLIAALAAKVDDTEVGAALGVAPLDLDIKVPAIYLPSTGADHLYTTQALMIADGTNQLKSELCLVSDDVDTAKNGEYVVLQDSPTLISHYYFKGDYVPSHTHTPEEAGADPVGSADAVQTNLDTHEADTANPHSVESGQVPYDNTVSGLTAVLVETAIDETVALTETAQADIDSHRLNQSNPHNVDLADLGAAADTEFDNKFGGHLVDGKHPVYSSDIDGLILDSVYFLSTFSSTHPEKFPLGMGSYGFVTTDRYVDIVLQSVRSVSNYPSASYRVSLDGGSSWSAWGTKSLAENIIYANSETQLVADNVQDAIDEVVGLVRGSNNQLIGIDTASSLDYDDEKNGTKLIVTASLPFTFTVEDGHVDGWNIEIINMSGVAISIDLGLNTTVNGSTVTLDDVCRQYESVFIRTYSTNEAVMTGG